MHILPIKSHPKFILLLSYPELSQPVTRFIIHTLPLCIANINLPILLILLEIQTGDELWKLAGHKGLQYNVFLSIFALQITYFAVFKNQMSVDQRVGYHSLKLMKWALRLWWVYIV